MTHKQLAWAVESDTNLIVLLGLDVNAPPRPVLLFLFLFFFLPSLLPLNLSP